LGYAGFQEEDSDEDSKSGEDNDLSSANELLDLVLVKQIKELIDISRSKVEFRSPTVRLVLPRIEERQAPEYVTNVLKTIRNLGKLFIVDFLSFPYRYIRPVAGRLWR